MLINIFYCLEEKSIHENYKNRDTISCIDNLMITIEKKTIQPITLYWYKTYNKTTKAAAMIKKFIAELQKLQSYCVTFTSRNLHELSLAEATHLATTA